MGDRVKIEITTPSDAAADPLHPDHQRWVKTTLVEDERKRLQSIGADVPARVIEEDVDTTLGAMYAREREGVTERRAWQKRHTSGPKPAERLAERLGYHYRRAEEFDLSVRAYGCKRGCGGHCVRCRLETRIRALVSSEGAFSRRRFLYPRWAPLVINEWGNCTSERGEYAGKTPAEKNRILTRNLERIADQSTAVLGAWRP